MRCGGHLEADQVSDVMLGGGCNKLKVRKERGNAWNLRSDEDLGVFGVVLDAGRGDRIRTCDLYVPNVALYQTELHPEASGQWYGDSNIFTRILSHSDRSPAFLNNDVLNVSALGCVLM